MFDRKDFDKYMKDKFKKDQAEEKANKADWSELVSSRTMELRCDDPVPGSGTRVTHPKYAEYSSWAPQIMTALVICFNQHRRHIDCPREAK